jgi:hypothetical protein
MWNKKILLFWWGEQSLSYSFFWSFCHWQDVKAEVAWEVVEVEAVGVEVVGVEVVLDIVVYLSHPNQDVPSRYVLDYWSNVRLIAN